jgi:hypothetical protein
MPQIKAPQQHFGMHHELAPVVERWLNKRGIQFPDLASLVLVATKPQILEREDCAPERNALLSAIATQPDSTIALLAFIRKQLQGHPLSKAKVVRDFLISHNAVVKTKGKFRLISNLTKGDFDSSPDSNIRTLKVSNTLIPVSKLTDGEIAQILRVVSPDDVRKERQRIVGKGKK